MSRTVSNLEVDVSPWWGQAIGHPICIRYYNAGGRVHCYTTLSPEEAVALAAALCERARAAMAAQAEREAS